MKAITLSINPAHNSQFQSRLASMAMIAVYQRWVGAERLNIVFKHENRETSETPAAQPSSRSAGEGKSRTARSYVTEESHGGIGPMNHSNDVAGLIPVSRSIQSPTRFLQKIDQSWRHGAATFRARQPGTEMSQERCLLGRENGLPSGCGPDGTRRRSDNGNP